MSKDKKSKAVINYKKALSHIEKVMQMTEDERYCIDIIQQNLAIIGLIKSANSMLMKNHLSSCFSDAMKTRDVTKQEAMMEEIIRAMKMSDK